MKNEYTMEIRRVDNKYLPERIVEYLNRDESEKEYAESLGINAEAEKILKAEEQRVLQQLENDRQNVKLLLEMVEVERQMGSLYYYIGGMNYVISEEHFNIAANCMGEVMALGYSYKNEVEYAQVLMEYGTVLVKLMELNTVPNSVISPAEADAASVIRNAVDIYRKNLDYPNEESVKQYRDSLQLFGEACYLSLLLRDQEESQEENVEENQEEYN